MDANCDPPATRARTVPRAPDAAPGAHRAEAAGAPGSAAPARAAERGALTGGIEPATPTVGPRPAAGLGPLAHPAHRAPPDDPHYPRTLCATILIGGSLGLWAAIGWLAHTLLRG